MVRNHIVSAWNVFLCETLKATNKADTQTSKGSVVVSGFFENFWKYRLRLKKLITISNLVCSVYSYFKLFSLASVSGLLREMNHSFPAVYVDIALHPFCFITRVYFISKSVLLLQLLYRPIFASGFIVLFL